MPTVPAGTDRTSAAELAAGRVGFSTCLGRCLASRRLACRDRHEELLLSPLQARAAGGSSNLRARRILVVDDDVHIRKFCQFVLKAESHTCTEAVDGVLGLDAANAEPCDLILLDIDMPRMSGPEVLRQLRERPCTPNLKIIMFSGRANPDELSNMLIGGADGYLTKPFSAVQLLGQVKAALRLKDAQDRSDLLNSRLLGINSELERSLSARDSDIVHSRNALVSALATLVKYRDGETGRMFGDCSVTAVVWPKKLPAPPVSAA